MIITLINYTVKLLCCSHILSPNSDSGLIAIKKFSYTVVNKSRWGPMDEGLFVGKEVVATLWIKRYNIECFTACNIPLRQDSVTPQHKLWFTSTFVLFFLFSTSFLKYKKKEKEECAFLFIIFSLFHTFGIFFIFRGRILFAGPFLQICGALAPISFELRLFKVVYRMTQTHVPHAIFLKFISLPHCEASGVFVPQSGIEPRPLSVRAWSPNHWTSRESPCILPWHFKILFKMPVL